MRSLAIFAGMLALWSGPLEAQETRETAENHVSPPATLAQVTWLVGRWGGSGIAGAPAMESWLPPAGSTMVGTFVQQTAAGGIMFTEHLYLMEENGTLVLRLKHFNADLTGWEDKEGMVTFRLIAVEPCAAYFRSLTLRCDKGPAGEDGLLAAVKVREKDGKTSELVFRFTRMS